MEQMNIFECLYDTYKIKKPIRLIEFFAGIGSQAKALENLKANFEHWKICEWAIPSILAYNEIHQDYLKGYGVDYSKDLTKEQLVDYLHNKGISSNYNEPMTFEQIKKQSEGKLRNIYNAIISENNLVNIQQTHGKDLHIEETNKYDYILSYSFPCQDLSNAGKGRGMAKGSGTRSGMLWEVERILLECEQLGELPQVLLMENVPQVIGEKNIEHFKKWQAQLERLGYTSYCEILSAKDYGIPQSRQRAFMISILGNYNYKFPRPMQLKLKVKDILENNVNDKYFLSDKMINCMLSSSENNGQFPRKEQWLRSMQNTNSKQIATTITCRSGERATDNFIIVKEATKIGYAKAYEGDCVNLEQPNSKTRRGRVGRQLAQTLLTSCLQGVVIKDNEILRIRKITTIEAYRLMGFTDLDEARASKVINDRMIYHTAGDSIVVNVLMAIFSQLL